MDPSDMSLEVTLFDESSRTQRTLKQVGHRHTGSQALHPDQVNGTHSNINILLLLLEIPG